MEEVSNSAATVRRQEGWSAVAFWLLASLGVGLFAVSVLATAYMERHRARQQIALERARTRQLEQYNEDLRIARDALKDDPKHIARQIREGLGYARRGEEPLPFATDHRGPKLAPLEPELPPETALSRLCAVFSQAVFRRMSLMSGLMLVTVAFVIFDIPTRQGSPSAGRDTVPRREFQR